MQHVPCCNTLEGASEEWQNWPATTCTYHPRRRGNCPRQRRPHRSCVCRGHRPTSLPEPPQSRRARRPDPHTAEDNPFFPACLSVCHRVRQLALLHCYSLEPITAVWQQHCSGWLWHHCTRAHPKRCRQRRHRLAILPALPPDCRPGALSSHFVSSARVNWREHRKLAVEFQVFLDQRTPKGRTLAQSWAS